MYYPRRLPEFEAGVNEFLDASFAKLPIGGEIYCPCKQCRNCFWCSRKDVKDHLIGQGFVKNYYVSYGDKYIVPGEVESHVLQSIGALWRGHKSRIKKKHFYDLKDNITRLKQTSKIHPEKDFIQLLGFWNTKEAQKNEDPNKEPPSLTKMFERTCKRKGHLYADDTEKLIEQMKNYKALKEDGSGENGSASVDPFMSMMNKEYNGHRRLFRRRVISKLIKKVNGSETSYMVPGELMESVRTNIDTELNQLVEMRKQIEDDHEYKKLEIVEEHKRNKAELEDMRKGIEDQHEKLVEDAVAKIIRKLPPRVVKRVFNMSYGICLVKGNVVLWYFRLHAEIRKDELKMSSVIV